MAYASLGMPGIQERANPVCICSGLEDTMLVGRASFNKVDDPVLSTAIVYFGGLDHSES